MTKRTKKPPPAEVYRVHTTLAAIANELGVHATEDLVQATHNMMLSLSAEKMKSADAIEQKKKVDADLDCALKVITTSVNQIRKARGSTPVVDWTPFPGAALLYLTREVEEMTRVFSEVRDRYNALLDRSNTILSEIASALCVTGKLVLRDEVLGTIRARQAELVEMTEKRRAAERAVLLAREQAKQSRDKLAILIAAVEDDSCCSGDCCGHPKLAAALARVQATDPVPVRDEDALEAATNNWATELTARNCPPTGDMVCAYIDGFQAGRDYGRRMPKDSGDRGPGDPARERGTSVQPRSGKGDATGPSVPTPPPEHLTPRLGVAVLVFDDAGRLLLGRRGKQPNLGTWVIPGGGVEPGESWCATAKRELLEETGLRVHVDQSQRPSILEILNEHEHRVILCVTGSVESGRLQPSSDLLDAKFFARNEMPDDISPAIRPVLAKLWGSAPLTTPCCNPECAGEWGTGCDHCHFHKCKCYAPEHPKRTFMIQKGDVDTLTVTEKHALPPNFSRWIEALCEAKYGTLFLSEYQFAAVVEIALDLGATLADDLRRRRTPYEMASCLMFLIVKPHGEFDLQTTPEGYAAEVACWREKDGKPIPEEAFVEIQIAAASALDLNASEARRHFQKAAALAGWS